MTRPSSVPPPVTAVLDASSRWLPARLAAAEELLRAAVAGPGETLGEDAAATLEAGGKRLRPMLVLLCAGPDGGEGAVRAAAAIELIHMATLVHDDVLDAAAVRRHVPTVNALWGNQASILLGDYLFTHAFHLSATLGDARACRIIGASTNRVCEGELRQGLERGNLELSEEDYFEIIEGKTAELIAC
ncbi:MAG TPA: polyprenyl synthetase family protein, partial [Solirubrobacterales bacterium]|nr:polyprenyl synthetase family protein [Solirubrobacterales bacterium]